MEENQAPSDDPSHYHGGIAEWKRTWRNAWKALIYAIRTSETYQNYQRCELKLSRQPELRKKIDQFRKKVFQINTSDQVDLFEEADRLEKESQELRLNPVVNDFLAVEQDVCSMLREVTGRISDEVQIRLPEL